MTRKQEKQFIMERQLLDLPDGVLDALSKEISRAMEKQYRKGLQHGAHFLEDGRVTIKDVDDFRYQGIKDDYKKANDIQQKGHVWKSPFRYFCELDDHPLIRSILMKQL